MVAYTVSKNFGGEKNPETIALAGYIKNKICEPTKKRATTITIVFIKANKFCTNYYFFYFRQRSPTTFVYKIIFAKLDKI